MWYLSISNIKYVGQTRRSVLIKYETHFRDFKYTKTILNFAQHVLDYGHCIGRTQNIMEILHTVTKRRVMNTLKTFYIFNITRSYQINDECVTKSNYKNARLFSCIIVTSIPPSAFLQSRV